MMMKFNFGKEKEPKTLIVGFRAGLAFSSCPSFLCWSAERFQLSSLQLVDAEHKTRLPDNVAITNGFRSICILIYLEVSYSMLMQKIE